MFQRSPVVALFCVCLASACFAQDQQRPQPAPATEPQPVRPAYRPQDQQTIQTRPAPAAPTAVEYASRNAYGTIRPGDDSSLSSTYISVDSWMYPAMLRLYSMGYLNTAFLSMRPWTRRSALHMLQESQPAIMADGNEQATEILAALLRALDAEVTSHGVVYGLESAYANIRINGGSAVLRDSYHIGQSYINDYGRPAGTGFNTYDGFSTVAEYGRFSLHTRGEYQHAAPAEGYDLALATAISNIDAVDYTGYNVPQDTVPAGNLGHRDNFRLIDAYASVHLLNHEVSFGKMDNWLGPTRGGALAWSNNADNIYAFRINRVEPLHIPYLSVLTGPIRYDFFVGTLQGHTYPNSPWVHSTMFSFTPTPNFQFAFQRTVIWGGKDHTPITIHTFLKSFFDVNDTTGTEKYSRADPGARFSDFSATYRLPFVRRYATFLLDSICHDDVTPISAPRRAAFRTGLYLSQLPHLPKWEVRVEAVMTDPRVTRSNGGNFVYLETVQRQGYTNKGNIMGDWMGREGKGGQAWITYNLSPTEKVEFEYRNKKNAKDFIAQGTTQNTYTLNVVKRIAKDVELSASLAYESWKAPIYKQGQQNLTTGTFQVKWYPKLRTASTSY